jgi:hypothetical protein
MVTSAVILLLVVPFGNTSDYIFYGTLLTIFNVVCWHFKSWYLLKQDNVSKRDRLEWEASMLNALNMVKLAGDYYEGESGTIMAAYHDLVTIREAEGFKKGYINKSRL